MSDGDPGMKNFMADDEFSVLANSLFQQRPVLFKIVAGVVVILVLIGLGLEVHHLLPANAP